MPPTEGEVIICAATDVQLSETELAGVFV